MASVGNGQAGRTLIGTGVTSSPTFASIGTSSGLTQYGVLLGGGSSAFTVTTPGTLGYVLTSGGPGSPPSYLPISSSGAVTTLTGNTGGALSPTAGNFNTVGTGSITIAGSGSTLTTQLTGITNHAIQIGAGTATLTQLASGTTGQVLQTNTGADPTWSTATYPSTTTVSQILYSSATNTVTGLATANNGVLITSATGVPSLLANGTTGQVLTATTGSPPSWGAAPVSFAPNSTIQLFDDFIGVNEGTTSTFISNYVWTPGGTAIMTFGSTVGDSGHNGVLQNIAFANTNASQLFLNANSGSVAPQMILGGGAITLNWVFKLAVLSAASPRYILRCGFGDTATAAQVNGVYFEYSDNVNSGNWQYVTANASTRTTSNSSIAADTSYHNFQVTINAAGTSCSFTIDGVSLGTANTTNIPTLAITPFFMCKGSVGTVAAGTVKVDLFYMTQTLTTPR